LHSAVFAENRSGVDEWAKAAFSVNTPNFSENYKEIEDQSENITPFSLEYSFISGK